MKRNHIFIYNKIDKQNLSHANQLTVRDWNNIINQLSAQHNDSTKYLETWQRWFFGPSDFVIDGNDYVSIPSGFDSYYDYLTSEFEDVYTALSNTLKKCNKIVEDVTSRLNNIEGDETIPGSIRSQVQGLQDKLVVGGVEVEYSRIAKNYLKSDNTSENIENKFNELASKVAANASTINGYEQQVAANRTAISENTQQIANNTSDIVYNRSVIMDLTNNLSAAYDILGTKLNKVWNDIALANELGDNDYFIINSGSNAYKITFSQFKNLVGGSGEGGVNHYKGDFLSYAALINATYDGTITPQAGDYAFVNTTDYTTETPKDYLVMYIWDVDADTWKETTSDKYVQSIVFDDFQYDLLNGLFVVQSAKNAEEAEYANTAGRAVNADNADNATEATTARSYINSDGVKSSISESFDSKQDKLKAGNGISISEDGVISVSYPNYDEEEF